MARPRIRGDSYQLRATINGVTKTTTWKIPAGMTAKQAEKQAQKEQDKFEDLCRRGIDTNKVTFKELSDQFLTDKQDELKPSTLTGYYYKLSKINEEIGHLDVKVLASSKAIIRNYIENLKQPYYTASGIEKYRTAETIIDYYRTISTVLTYACELDLIRDNPCTQKGIRLPRKKPNTNKIIPAGVINGYISAMETAPIIDKTFFHLVLATGARKGEALALRWSDIDFENHKITFCQSCQYVKGEGITYTTPKTESSERSVENLPEEVFSLLEELRLKQKQDQLKAGRLWNKKCDRVFVNEINEQIHPDTPRKNIQKIGEKAGLPRITVHKLRHFLVSVAIEQGTPITTISGFVGHSTPRITTQVYAHEIRLAGKAKSLPVNINDYLKEAK